VIKKNWKEFLKRNVYFVVKSASIHVEAELHQYVMNMRKNEFAVPMEMLQFEGCRLARKPDISVSKFKVSYGWVRHFMARHDLP
jgi:hypothetical protein